jgi:hypothetical protein
MRRAVGFVLEPPEDPANSRSGHRAIKIKQFNIGIGRYSFRKFFGCAAVRHSYSFALARNPSTPD